MRCLLTSLRKLPGYHGHVYRYQGSNKQYMNQQWQEVNGHRLQDVRGSGTEAFEKEEWIIKQTTTMRWTKQKAMNRWNAEIYEGYWQGEDGEVRLWLPRKDYKGQERLKYMDQRSQSSSPESIWLFKEQRSRTLRILTPPLCMLSACTCLPKGVLLNFQHEFFKGGAGVPYIENHGHV